jgi:membrane protein YqaA with SNARE-associated domain
LISKLRDRWPHLLALAVAVGAIAIIPFLPVHWRDLRSYGYLGIFLINVVGSGSLFFPVPGLAVAFVGGGASLNPWLVALCGAAGSTIGELTGYLAGYGGQVLIENNKRYAQVEGWMRRYGDLTVFVMAAVPNPLFDLAGLASGSLRFPVWRFLLMAFLGKLVKFTVFTLLGAASIHRIIRFFT